MAQCPVFSLSHTRFIKVSTLCNNSTGCLADSCRRTKMADET